MHFKTVSETLGRVAFGSLSEGGGGAIPGKGEKWLAGIPGSLRAPRKGLEPAARSRECNSAGPGVSPAQRLEKVCGPERSCWLAGSPPPGGRGALSAPATPDLEPGGGG